LVVDTDARIVNGLIFVEFRSAKRCSVGMVAGDINPTFFGPFFEGVFAFKDFSKTEGNLVDTVDVLCGVVNEESPAGIYIFDLDSLRLKYIQPTTQLPTSRRDCSTMLLDLTME
jgi:hypothetical protein